MSPRTGVLLPYVLECTDPWDRVIVLDEYVWVEKIVRGGTRLPESSLDSVRLTITDPAVVTYDKTHADGECFYAPNVLSGKLERLYLKVCVKIEDVPGASNQRGRIITAYPTDRIPKRERQKWP